MKTKTFKRRKNKNQQHFNHVFKICYLPIIQILRLLLSQNYWPENVFLYLVQQVKVK